MANPFSPFVGRNRIGKPDLKRRQSELPSDLIDWDAPEIPELEKQRIIYEDYIRESDENYEIETLINEEIFQVTLETIVDSTVKHYEEEINKEKSKVHLLLGQIKMFEDNVKDLEEELTNHKNMVSNLEEQKENLNREKSTLTNTIDDLKQQQQNLLEERTSLTANIEGFDQQKESWEEERLALRTEIENLTFRNNEISCELNHKLETFLQKKAEAEDFKKKWADVKNQLNYYRKLAKNKD